MVGSASLVDGLSLRRWCLRAKNSKQHLPRHGMMLITAVNSILYWLSTQVALVALLNVTILVSNSESDCFSSAKISITPVRTR